MKFKGTASLMVVFLILGVYYFFVDLPGEKKKLQQKEIAGKVLPFKNEDIKVPRKKRSNYYSCPKPK